MKLEFTYLRQCRLVLCVQDDLSPKPARNGALSRRGFLSIRISRPVSCTPPPFGTKVPRYLWHLHDSPEMSR